MRVSNSSLLKCQSDQFEDDVTFGLHRCSRWSIVGQGCGVCCDRIDKMLYLVIVLVNSPATICTLESPASFEESKLKKWLEKRIGVDFIIRCLKLWGLLTERSLKVSLSSLSPLILAGQHMN